MSWRRIALPADIYFLRIIGNWCRQNPEAGERFVADETFREDVLAELEKLVSPPPPEPVADIMAALKRSLAEPRRRRSLLTDAIDETARRNGK